MKDSQRNAAAVLEQKYLVLVIDVATMNGTEAAPGWWDDIVMASSHEEAEQQAVAAHTADNDIGPDEDGGFLAITSYTRDELLALIGQMSD